MTKRAIVCGAGGFIGGHLVTRLKKEGWWVRGLDIKANEFKTSDADEFILTDLRDPVQVDQHFDSSIDEVYQLAADMGGALFVFTGEHDADIMHNSATINLNVCDTCVKKGIRRVFYSSSACMYPEHNQLDPLNPVCTEDSAYPAAPDSEYGWEKLFSERLFLAYNRNYQLEVRIARFHNIFGPLGTWEGGREKAPAALSRKIAMAKDGDTIEVWGDGLQTRSFLLVEECVEGILRLMRSECTVPVNIGSDEMVTINELAHMIIGISGKKITLSNIPGPTGVRGRCSENTLIKEKINWAPSSKLIDGLRETYHWINKQVQSKLST